MKTNRQTRARWAYTARDFAGWSFDNDVEVFRKLLRKGAAAAYNDFSEQLICKLTAEDGVVKIVIYICDGEPDFNMELPFEEIIDAVMLEDYLACAEALEASASRLRIKYSQMAHKE